MIIIEQFINDELRIPLCRHAIKLKNAGVLRVNTPKRYLRKIFNTPYANTLVKNLEKRIRNKLDLDDIITDPILGWVVSYIEPGGRIHMHYDNHKHYRDQNRKHLRCNVVVSKLPDSGNPIVAGTTYKVCENDLWAFFAHKDFHGSEEVVGEKPRIIYQFGFSVGDDIDIIDIERKLLSNNFA